MFSHYIKIAYRNLVKNRVSALINIFGLTLGLTSCILIGLYIEHELSYDRFELKGARICRVIMEYSFDGGGTPIKGDFTSVRVAAVLPRNFPEIQAAVKMTKREMVVRSDDHLTTEKRFMFADSNFFQVFSFPLLQGNPAQVLKNPRSVVVTQSTGKRYFGDQNPVGRTLLIGSDSSLYLITGVMADCPSSSQIKLDMVASFSSLGIGKEFEDSYWDANYTTYLLLHDPSSMPSLQTKLFGFMKKEMAGSGATVNFYLEPMDQIHLHSPYSGFEPNSSMDYIYILAAVALVILVIACSTFINLSTARSIQRAKEVGVRKVAGAARSQLFWQFIAESGALCLVALVCSLALALIALPYFNHLTAMELVRKDMVSPFFLSLWLGGSALVALAAGAYPAIILTRYEPTYVLKGYFLPGGGGQWLRKSLLVFQFGVSASLIVATLVIQKQLFFIQHKQLGYDRDRVLVLPMDNGLLSRVPLIKTAFRANPDILRVSRSVSTPVTIASGYNMRSAQMPQNQQVAVTATPVDQDYLQTVGLQLVAGSDFTDQDVRDASWPASGQPAGTYHFILNESAARQLGWTPAQAVGQRMFLDASRPGVVRGVVRDFHFESLHVPIRPLVLFTEDRGRVLLVKISGKNLAATLAFLEAKWKSLVPERPFAYRFLDEDFNKLYTSELRLSEVMDLFASMAIVLACLGLFGLVSYGATQRVREIGLRKTLGASTQDIVLLLSGGFVRLALIGLAIALPFAWWGMDRWLQQYAYRTPLGWGAFLGAGLVTLVLVGSTIALRALQAAQANPARSLRSE